MKKGESGDSATAKYTESETVDQLHEDRGQTNVQVYYNGPEDYREYIDDEYSVEIPVGPVKYPPDFQKVKVSSSYFQLQLEINELRSAEQRHYCNLKSVMGKILSEHEETNSRLRSIEMAISDSKCYEPSLRNKRQRPELAELKFIRTTAPVPPKPICGKDSPYFIFDTNLSKSTQRRHHGSDELHDIHDMHAEFRSCAAEDELVRMIYGCEKCDMIISIKSSIFLKEHLEPLIKHYDYDALEKCLDDKIVDARINDMRAKVPQQTRLDGSIFIELSSMTSVICNEGKHPIADNVLAISDMRKTAKIYLKHKMIFFPLCLRNHLILVVVNTARHEIQILNSKVAADGSEDEHELLKGVHELHADLERYLKHAKDWNNWWPNLDMTSWTVNSILGLPQQEDNTSCALFMLKYAKHWMDVG